MDFILTDEDNEPIRRYTNPECVKFCRDVEGNYDLRHYRGRFYWEGPAVVAESFSEIAALTSVEVQHDNMGMRYIIYPLATDKGELPVVDA